MPSLQSYFQRWILSYNKSSHSAPAPLEEQRAAWEEETSRMRLPNGVLKQPVTAGGVAAEWIHPQEAPREKVLFYLHGGAYVMGSCNTHRNMAAHMARACGMRALLLDYRLAPEHPFPAALDDAVAAYHWLLCNLISAENIVIAGDSAGGGLALATLVSLRDGGYPLPAAGVCLTPWTDLAGTAESLETRVKADPKLTLQDLVPGRHYVGENDPCHPLISPLYADLRGLPPLLIHGAGDDMLLDDAVRVAERAKAAGVDVTLEVWKRMWHVFHRHAPKLPEARRAVESIGTFARRRLAEAGGVVGNAA
ncbi:MAG: hypothetical protein A2X58_11335 [Nitrospirae bacterium GWC2_56_14]|nr:MAG: hypothetical protein A2X58_11335 [Nitrospirae bacterium GWC2_56_14]